MKSAPEAGGARAASPRAARLREQLESVFFGQRELIERLLAALLADGHVLLEGAPGLGKTRLVRALAESLDLSYQRIQGTPDLLPGDVTGSEVLEERDGRRSFRFERGPVFAHVLLVDEINRATPRTQSALLEAMEERQVTAGKESHALPEPFFVAATQNPIELEGTYPLPEAQLDRFLFLLQVRPPEPAVLERILEDGGERRALEPVMTREELLQLRRDAHALPVAGAFLRALAAIVHDSHPGHDSAPPVVREQVAWGASPRAGLATLAAGRALALLRGREHVAPEDLRDALFPAFRHRILLRYEARAAGAGVDDILHALLERHPLR